MPLQQVNPPLATVQSDNPKQKNKFVIAAVVGVLILIVGSLVAAAPPTRSFLFFQVASASTKLSNVTSLTASNIPISVTPKTNVKFEKRFEISANQNATPRGYIAASIDGKTFLGSERETSLYC